MTARANDEPFQFLGRSDVPFPSEPSASTLETFANRYPQRHYTIRFQAPDFTSLCPVTGQPDFAKIEISYIAGDLCLESKSLKFYLSAFRNTRSFNEEIVNRMLDDLIAACQPRQMTVRGEFAPRGGISLTVEASHPKPAAI